MAAIPQVDSADDGDLLSPAPASLPPAHSRAPPRRRVNKHTSLVAPALWWGLTTPLWDILLSDALGLKYDILRCIELAAN